jgi:mevalonate kinase
MSGAAPADERVEATACGKVILLGEHFVVPQTESAGAPAIALPLRGLTCDVSVARSGRMICVAEGAPEYERATIEEKMARAVSVAVEGLGIRDYAIEVRSRATFPGSRGFGSSAAFSVALTRALDAFVPKTPSSRDLGIAAHAVESVFHGASSGLDTAVVLAERMIRFHHGRVVRPVPCKGVAIVVLDSGPRETAALLIEQVRELRARRPASWAQMATRVSGLVDRCERALGSGQAAVVGALVNEAHAMLADLGLTNPRIEKLLADARAVGALGGKVSGAGAGGAVILVTPARDGKRLARAMAFRGHTVVAVSG